MFRVPRPPVPGVPDRSPAAAAASAPALRQVVALTRWIGPGRKLTQTGQLTMADARHLVGLLETGDQIDPVIGTRMFRTRSSAELPRLAIVLAWAKVRVPRYTWPAAARWPSRRARWRGGWAVPGRTVTAGRVVRRADVAAVGTVLFDLAETNRHLAELNSTDDEGR